MKIIQTDKAITIDTSRCRSPSRALRRFRRGIRGHVVVTPVMYKIPGAIVMHPALYPHYKAAERMIDAGYTFISGDTGLLK